MASGVTPVAIWSGYRDETAEGLSACAASGTRTTNKYRVKTAGWNKYRSMTGSTASTNPEACWIPGSYFRWTSRTRPDTLRTTSSNDWAYGHNKGVCAPGERIMGLSKSIANGWACARAACCYKDPLDSGRYLHPIPTTNPPPTTPHAPRCTARRRGVRG